MTGFSSVSALCFPFLMMLRFSRAFAFVFVASSFYFIFLPLANRVYVWVRLFLSLLILLFPLFSISWNSVFFASLLPFVCPFSSLFFYSGFLHRDVWTVYLNVCLFYFLWMTYWENSRAIFGIKTICTNFRKFFVCVWI